MFPYGFDLVMQFRESKLRFVTSKKMFLLEKSEAILRTISCDSWFFPKGSQGAWFSNSGLYTFDLNSSLLPKFSFGGSVEGLYRAHFVSLDKGFLDCFSSSDTSDYLIILPFSYCPFASNILGKIFQGWGLLVLCIIGSVKHWLRWLNS